MQVRVKQLKRGLGLRLVRLSLQHNRTRAPAVPPVVLQEASDTPTAKCQPQQNWVRGAALAPHAGVMLRAG